MKDEDAMSSYAIVKRQRIITGETDLDDDEMYDDVIIDPDNEDDTESSSCSESMFSFLALLESVKNIQSDRGIDSSNNTTSVEIFNDKLLFKQITRLFKFNLYQLNLSKKETLMFLIEWNCSQCRLLAPFDQLAYNRLAEMHMTQRRPSKLFESYVLHNSSNTSLEYNLLTIRRLSFILKACGSDPLDRRFLRKNSLLLNTQASFLAPFYLDIFPVSEIERLFNNFQIDLIKQMRHAYTEKFSHKLIKRSRLDNAIDFTTLTDYIAENIVWNCLILFKYHFTRPNRHKMSRVASTDTFQLRAFRLHNRQAVWDKFYYINFYLSFVYISVHLDLVISYKNESNATLEIQKLATLNQLLPKLLETLILSNHVSKYDLARIESCFTARLTECGDRDDLESMYYKKTLNEIKSLNYSTPLTLKHLCRVRIKESLVEFDMTTLNQINDTRLTGELKRYVLFDHEIQDFFGDMIT